MQVAWVGLGKLGYVCSHAAARAGHQVAGYDVNHKVLSFEPRAYQEAKSDGTGDFNDYLRELNPTSTLRHVHYNTGGSMRFASSVADAMLDAEIIFVSVQTPHDPLYEGVNPLPAARKDFDYSYLRAAVRAIVEHLKPDQVITVVSTVMPGTMRREVLPLLPAGAHVAYNPSFIAMSTTYQDYVDPEMVLIGHTTPKAFFTLEQFYKGVFCVDEVDGRHAPIVDLWHAPIVDLSIESAECAKLFYNCLISMKIGARAVFQEICDKIKGADIDEVLGALSLAWRRLGAGSYFGGKGLAPHRAGMGDGGGCHPRDNIAMSWLARELHLHHDPFNDAMLSRDNHAEWLAKVLILLSIYYNMEIRIMGLAYKAGVSIRTGSHAVLLVNTLRRMAWDPEIDDARVPGSLGWEKSPPPDGPRVFFIGCLHPEYLDEVWPRGSVVVDPFCRIPDQDGVEIIRLGSKERGA